MVWDRLSVYCMESGTESFAVLYRVTVVVFMAQ